MKQFERLFEKRRLRRTVNLDFDARVPIPFSVFPSTYRSDAVSETTQTRVEAEVNFDSTSRAGREDTRKEEVDVRIRTDERLPGRRFEETRVYEERPRYQEERPRYQEDRPRYPEVELTRERYREPIGRFEERREERYEEQREERHQEYREERREERRTAQDKAFETQLDITEREYRRRVDPRYEVDVTFDRRYQPNTEAYRADSYDIQEVTATYNKPSTEVKISKETIQEEAPNHKMGYYDDDGRYHSFRRGVERATDRLLHPFSHDHHHREEVVVEDGPSRYREGVREEVRVVEPRGGSSSSGESVPIPVHFIRIGDLLVLQGRPCQVIRISVSPQTGQHRYLGVDLFTRQLHEESSFVSNPSPSVIVQTMLGPVYKTYRVLDVRDDGRLVAMTENGDVKQGLPVITQGGLFQRIRDAYNDGRGSVRALVINDGGRELVVDYKIIHGSRL